MDKLGFLVGLLGMWILSDSIFSILTYLDNKNETFLRNQSIRVVRLLCAIALIGIGWVL